MIFPEEFRIKKCGDPHYNSNPGDGFGAFLIPAHKAPRRRQLNILACDAQDTGWEHVSVRVDQNKTQTPTWEEMCFVKDLFWPNDQWVVQFHPAADAYVNQHPGVLHLWRCTVIEQPTPPKICV